MKKNKYIKEVSAGGVVFNSDKVFLLKNDENKWVLPKGHIKSGESYKQAAEREVREETDLNVEVKVEIGTTRYKFFWEPHDKHYDKTVYWFVMTSCDNDYHVQKEEGFVDGGFFRFPEALKIIEFLDSREILKKAIMYYHESLSK